MKEHTEQRRTSIYKYQQQYQQQSSCTDPINSSAMRSITAIVAAILLATVLLTAEAFPSNDLIRTKRQAGTMNCLLYGICGKPHDYRNYHYNKRYGAYYHNKYYHRKGHGHYIYGRH